MLKHLYFPLIICIISFLPEIGVAQSFKSGLTVGVSNARVLGGVNKEGWRQFGIIAGPFVEYDLNELSGLKMEMLFSQKGERKPYRPNAGDYTFYKLRLNYIEIPVLYFHSHNKFIFEAGPSFGYLIGHKVEDLHGPTELDRPYKKLDFGANLGINYQLTEHLDMNWRYSNSIIPVRDHIGNVVWRYNRGEYNSVLTFKVIYWFNKNHIHTGGK
ncbi:MAG: PorT family protein [Bacteroidota bacterium]|nr:PorT family protein [Bacteroidota bacterium]